MNAPAMDSVLNTTLSQRYPRESNRAASIKDREHMWKNKIYTIIKMNTY